MLRAGRYAHFDSRVADSLMIGIAMYCFAPDIAVQYVGFLQRYSTASYCLGWLALIYSVKFGLGYLFALWDGGESKLGRLWAGADRHWRRRHPSGLVLLRPHFWWAVVSGIIVALVWICVAPSSSNTNAILQLGYE